MKLGLAVRATACCIFLIFTDFSAGFASQPSIVYTRPPGIVHQYPLTGSVDVPVGTDIGIRAVSAYDPVALAKQSFVATGSLSGAHTMNVHLSRDRTMAIFHATTPFSYGEEVQFVLTATLLASPAMRSGMTIADSINFTTIIRPAPPIPSWVINEGLPGTLGSPDSSIPGNDSLPEMTITVDDMPTAGTIYFDNFGFVGLPNQCFNFTTDQNGVISRAEELPGSSSRDFKPQPNGISTYLDADYNIFYGLDSAWDIIDTFVAVNYPTDQHELRVFPDGSYALLGISTSYVDMAQYVPGGFDSAIVLGAVIQTFDPDHNLIFQWRGIDHYNVYDSKYEDLTSTEIDFEHANSLDFDSSGNILLSNRHLCEISQINGVTGDFIWRFGGAHNQFTLVGDSIPFSFQHDARWIPGGDLTVFDNSNYDTIIAGNGAWIQQSRALEYSLDTTNMTATLMWQFHHTPETWSSAMGSVERLPNGNTFIGWGDDTGVSMTEVDPNNNTVYEMTMGNYNVSYRAYKDVPTFGVIGVIDTQIDQVAASSAPGVGNTLEIETGTGGTLSAVLTLGQSQLVTLALYDMVGREVRAVLNAEWEGSGNHEIPLDLSSLPNGAYECVLTGENATLARGFAVFK
jgi:hypothetical protein